MLNITFERKHYLGYKYIMKKFLGVALITALICMPICYGIQNPSVITLDNNEIEKVKLGVTDNSKDNVNNAIFMHNSEDLASLIDEQKEHDIKDLEILWKGTVENNQVIEFALKKLSTPESQRRIHSSLMAKTLSAIITGASFIPSVMGSNYGIQTASYSAGRLIQGLMNRKNVPTETPLTDTELIELAGMVEDLQDALISAYYNYKNTLSLLKDTRARMLLYGKNYSKALDGKDILEISINSALYDSMRLREFSLEQNAKKYHIQLQRLAGKKAVDSLELYQYDFNSVLYKDVNTSSSEDSKKKTKGGANGKK